MVSECKAQDKVGVVLSVRIFSQDFPILPAPLKTKYHGKSCGGWFLM